MSYHARSSFNRCRVARQVPRVRSNICLRLLSIFSKKDALEFTSSTKVFKVPCNEPSSVTSFWNPVGACFAMIWHWLYRSHVTLARAGISTTPRFEGIFDDKMHCHHDLIVGENEQEPFEGRNLPHSYDPQNWVNRMPFNGAELR